MEKIIDEVVEDSQVDRYLAFSVDCTVIGLEINIVSEIISMIPITQVPEAPNYVKGVINLRGKILPVIDMRLKFKKEFIEYSERTCIVVVDMADIPVGLIVDNVEEVLYIPEESIVPPPDFKTGIQNRYIKGIGKIDNQVKLLLDCERILSDEEFEEFSKINEIITAEER